MSTIAAMPIGSGCEHTLLDGFEPVACPGCGGERCSLVLEAGNPTLGPEMYPSMRFRVVRCDDCGLHYTNPRPTLASLSRFYPTEYSPYRMDKASRTDADNDNGAPARRRTVRQLVLRHAFGAPHLKPRGIAGLSAWGISRLRRPEWFGFGVAWRGQGRLLDFGCGSGKFLARMARLGWQCTGIDFSETAVQRAGSIPGVRAILGTLPHPELAPGSFDVVTLRHALEHVPDPPAILRAAWELLDGGGLLLIQAPNFDCFDIRRFGERALPLDLPRHLTHFTQPTLRAMLGRAGMTQVRVEQRSHANWIRKAAKSSPARSDRIYRNTPICRLTATLMRRRGLGNELLATAVK